MNLVPEMKQHIGSLDGIRGGLALWVFWGHLANAVGLSAPLLRAPALAVDLFMLLSGFLMSWHWEVDRVDPRKRQMPHRTINFWIRRFFRIAPLYYVLLAVAIALAPPFLVAQSHLQQAFFPMSPAAVGSGSRLLSAANIFSHLTFVYGLIPSLAANDALPDWSLSLEMQFYLVFPLLVAFCRPVRVIVFAIVSVVIALIAARLFGVGTSSVGILGQFPQPSVLPLKLHIFASGMALGLLAASPRTSERRVHFWIAFLIPLVVTPKPVWAVAIIVSALILSDYGPVRLVATVLGSAPFRLGADLSYGVYLVHYLPSYLLLDVALRHGLLGQHSAWGRFAAAITLMTVPVYLLAYALHRLVEKPGIRLGRSASHFIAERLIRKSDRTNAPLMQY